MIDSSILPTTIIQIICVLYSIFIAVFVFTYKEFEDEDRKEFLPYFNWLAIAVIITVFYNVFILYLLSTGQIFIDKIGLTPGEHDWRIISCGTFFIFVVYTIIFSRHLLKAQDNVKSFDRWDGALVLLLTVSFYILLEFNKMVLLTLIIYFPWPATKDIWQWMKNIWQEVERKFFRVEKR